MSPLERLDWLTKLARSGANFGMMAVASDIAYRAGDEGCFGLPDGGLKPAGARKARAALLAGGWVLRTKGAWFPAIGTATTVAKRYNGSATTVAKSATTVAVTATTVAKIATTVAHNRGTLNRTSNGERPPFDDDITQPGNIDPSLQVRTNYIRSDAKLSPAGVWLSKHGFRLCGKHEDKLAAVSAALERMSVEDLTERMSTEAGIWPADLLPLLGLAVKRGKDGGLVCPFPAGSDAADNWWVQNSEIK